MTDLLTQEKIAVSIQKLPNFKELDLPCYATDLSAGVDLVAALEEDVILEAGNSILVKTGLAIALPAGYEAQIRPRSGLALKNGITVLNTPGTIDADYRGEIGVILINHSKQNFKIERGMRIAQMVIAKFVKAEFLEKSSLESTQRGTGGFGSTGV